MIELLLLYKWAIFAGTVVAAALALLGCHLAARDKSMQTLCVGQGATLGVLLGMAFFSGSAVHEEAMHIGPFFAAAFFSIGVFWLSELIVGKRQASKNTFFSCLFASLLAMNYLVTAIIPALENHMAQVFFGDLATLTNTDALLTIALGAVLLCLLVVYWRSLSGQSFNEAIFGQSVFLSRGGLSTAMFKILTVAALSFSVQFLGFLFTMGCLFLPTTIASVAATRGLRNHFLFAAILAAVGTIVGFTLSLAYTRLPTVPTVVLSILALGILGALTPSASVGETSGEAP